MSELTGLLYAQPSFFGGMASILDIGDTLTEFNRSLSGQQADMLALNSDWVAVGQALYAALDEYSSENQSESEDGKTR